MSGLGEQKKAEKLSAIQDAACALFRERGYEATTVREISKRAGIGLGTLFLYVEDKEELLALIFVDRLEALARLAFQTLPHKASLVDQYLHVFGHFVRFYAEDIPLSRVLVANILFASGRARERLAALDGPFFMQLMDLVAQAQARGDLHPDADPLLVATNAFGAYTLALLAFLNGMMPDADSTLFQIRLALDTQARGFLPEASSLPRRGDV